MNIPLIGFFFLNIYFNRYQSVQCQALTLERNAGIKIKDVKMKPIEETQDPMPPRNCF